VNGVAGASVDTQSVRYRLSWRQLGWLCGLLALMYGGFIVFLHLQFPDDPWSQTSSFFLPQIVLPVALVCFNRAMSLTLTPDALVTRNLSRRVIPWSAIGWITTESQLGTKCVVVFEQSGRRTRLRVPATGFLFWDRDFDAKFHTIGDWYLAHRGSAVR
jgi:hypothetical protein